ncbi:acid phosphatase, putative [Eimeria brunetti]|uniref:Acid phosphatase, putative n=1 Tax=Eimeria brunetti TaxID=51314 RepID=U6LR11_9EIME|nr:acid phosphatase, putative [Eimeria brunetti]
MAASASLSAGPCARRVALSAAMLCFFVQISAVFGQLRFAAIGNYGFDPSGQKEVAETLKKTATAERISFLVSPGSNFPGGVSGANDTKWEDSFENVYSDEKGALKMPFLTVLGAEDWSGNYTALRERTELVYGENSSSEITSNSPKWTLPNWWYHYAAHFTASTGSAFISSGQRELSVGLVFIDTWVLSSAFPFGEITERAWGDLEKTLNLAPKVFDFILVIGNRPIYSSGSSKGDSLLQYYLQPLLKKADVDAYVSGYDRDLELIQEDGITYVNCGTGSLAGTSALVLSSGSEFFSGEKGFCLFELTAEGLVTKLINGENGNTLFEHKQPLKSRPERSTIDQFNSLSEIPEVVYVPVPEMGKLPGKDVFVRVVGTIGLCILTVLASMGVATGISRAMK